MRKMFFYNLIIACGLLLGWSGAKAQESFSHFITAKGDKLYDGEGPFRFVSFNVPNLLFVEDPDWHFITAWEQEDAIRTVAQMGGKVIRTYTLSVQGGVNNSKGVKRSHVTGPGQFDEEVFKCMDQAIALAAKYKVRLIIPFVDQWNWIGGVPQYAALRGKKEADFWTDPQIREDFKKTIAFVLNRTNPITGVKYKDDKTILCWETGNEIYQATNEWTEDIIRYIKSLDGNHLVMDGKGLSDFAIESPLVDIVTSHYYNYSDDTPFALRAKKDREKAMGKKPFVIGEFGCSYPDDMMGLIDEGVKNGSAGILIWSLRFRDEKGGFYFHSDGSKPVVSRSYHWPGFLSNADYYEPSLIMKMRKAAAQVDNTDPKMIPVPDAPLLFPVVNGALSWRGSTGAGSYLIERAKDPAGCWEVVVSGVSDCLEPGIFYTDHEKKNETWYYRVKAQSESGLSVPSNVCKNEVK